MLELHVLASGSKGNAAIVRNASTQRAVLVDCGICRRDFFNRSEAVGVNPCEIEAVLITHEHTDHTHGLGVVMRGLAQQGCSPVLATHDDVSAASRAVQEAQDSTRYLSLDYLEPVELAGITITPLPTSHDAAASMGFRFEVDGDAIGYLTDSGVMTPEAQAGLQQVRILAIESNHDVLMLREGSYPYMVQQRILGEAGHLSNEQCCVEVEQLLHPGLEHIVAMHISENNNTFGRPVRALQKVLDAHNHPAQVQAAFPRTPLSIR